MKYIIISTKHGTGKKPTFWRANNAGYCDSPFAAGQYTEEEIKADPEYYNNGYSTVAIPLTDQAMRDLGFNVTYDDKSLKKFFQDTQADELEGTGALAE